MANWIGHGGTAAAPRGGDVADAANWEPQAVPSDATVVFSPGRYTATTTLQFWSLGAMSLGAGATLRVEHDLAIGSGSSIDGTLLLAGGTLLAYGSALSGHGTIAGSGLISQGLRASAPDATFDIRADGLIVVGAVTPPPAAYRGYSVFSGIISGRGELALDNTDVAFSTPRATVAKLSLASTHLQLQRSFVNQRAFTVDGGQIDLVGNTLVLMGETTLGSCTIDAISSKGTRGLLSLRSDTAITGDVKVFADTVVQASARVEQSGTLHVDHMNIPSARIAIAATGSWHLGGDASILLDNSTAGLVTNGGVLTKSGNGVSVVAPAVRNSGDIQVEGGTLELGGVTNGQGRLTVADGATIAFDAAVTYSQLLSFTGSGDVALLNDPTHFKACVAGFGDGDAFDLAGISAAAKTSYRPDETGDGGTLRLASGGHLVSLHFTDTHVAGGFHLSLDTTGTGALLTYAAPTA